MAAFSLTRLAVLLLAFVSSVLALQAELAGIVDWHRPFIGEPLLEPTPPLILPTSNGSRVLSLTKRNLIAALDLEGGDIVWRQQLEETDPVVSFHVQDDNVLLLSGPGASTARLLSLATGHVQWERTLLPTSKAILTTPVYLGTDASFVSSEDGSVVILSEGKRVTRLRLADGAIMWSMEAPGSGSTIMFKQIMASGTSVHVLGLHYSFAAQTLLTSTLDLATSIPKADMGQVPSIVHVPDQATIVASTEGQAKVAWTEHGRIRTVIVNQDGSLGETKDLMPGKGKTYSDLIDVGVRHRGIILGRRSDGGVDVIDVAGGKKVEEFELSETSPERSESRYSAVETAKGVVLNRVYWSFNMAVGVAQTIQIPDVKASDVITSGFTFNFDTTSHGVLLHAAVSPYVDAKQLPILVLHTSSGATQRMELDVPGWVREESLAQIKVTRFIELGEPEVEEVREVLAEEGFVGRTTRHLAELKDLPAYLIRFAKRFTSASYTAAIQMTPLSLSHLHRDQFGFQKLVVVATAKGKLFALDSSNGAIVWSRNLGLTNENGSQLDIEGMWYVRNGEGGRNPMLAIAAVKSVGESVSTVAYHVDAYTGQVEGAVDPVHHLPLGKTLFAGRPQKSFLLPFKNCCSGAQVLAVVDSSNILHIFPSCKKVAGGISEMSDKLFYTTSTRNIDGTVIKGYVPSSSTNGTSFNSALLWSHPFGPNEVVNEVQPLQSDAIASYGRMLGDKSTLYKYLNPHLTVITTFTLADKGITRNTAGKGTGKVYVLDSTTGHLVYSTQIDEVTQSGGIHAAMIENWLVYTWMDERGYKIGSVELYEDSEKKGVTPSLSTFDELRIKAFAQTYILPFGVKSLAFTTSKAGITPKEVIVVNHKNQIASIPRRLLDPRRPVGKPSSRDKEEMLIPYDAMLPIGPKQVISHKYDVIGAEHVVSSPALVESTSLVFTYGLDLFLTRGLSPSGTFDILSDSFNKVQLLLTLGVLTAGILVAGPAVQKKNLKMKWY
ncbi:hypothetical protein IAU60_001286 [Kwoniella sp. DSM 27419]